jgi:tetratricopeptide (TPR) repeat protein
MPVVVVMRGPGIVTRRVVPTAAIGFLATLIASLATAQDIPPAVGPTSLPQDYRPPYGDDRLVPFIPLHPRTVDDRHELEALDDFVFARALENSKRWSDALAALQKASREAPDSVPILRRLARLTFILGRTEDALQAAQKVLDRDPGDTETLSLLMNYYDRRDDAATAEKILTRLVENPRLDKKSPGYLYIERSLGLLYADKLDRPADAARALEIVLLALDDRSASKLTPTDQRRLLGLDEAATYGRFGEIFLQAKRFDLAATAFRRGLVYDPDNPILPRLLAQTELELDRPEAALSTLESYLKRQPQGREPYDLLVTILDRLKRPQEVLPRLEAAAANDPRNLPLQYLLADRYREQGQPEKANELYRKLLATQPDPQGFGAMAASLVREKKSAELLELLGKAFSRPETLEAVMPQIEAIGTDPEYASQLLDTALELAKADPPRLSKETRIVLGHIANRAKKLDKLVPIERIALQREPSPDGYRDFWLSLYRTGQYAEAATALEEMFAKYPDQKDAPTLAALAQCLVLTGQNEKALATSDEASRLDPDDEEAMRLKGYLLGKLGRNEEAIAHYRSMLDRFPDKDEVARVARSGLSIVYVNMDRLDEGEKELEILLEREPNDPGVNNDLGYLWADRGKNLEKAEAMIRLAIRSEPENSAYLDSLGWVLYRLGRFSEAVEPLEKASKDPSADTTIWDHLGDTYFKLDRREDARAAWQNAEGFASKAQPPDKRLSSIRRKLESLTALGTAGTPATGGTSPPQP